MTEKIKQGRDNKNVLVAILIDLSKAFGCMNHELLIAKLNAYGFDSLSLRFIFQETKHYSQFYIQRLLKYYAWCSAKDL